EYLKKGIKVVGRAGGIARAIIQKEERKQRIDTYNKNPTSLCKHCNNPIAFDVRNINTFCSGSCAASFNNAKRFPIRKTKETKQKISRSLSKRYATLKKMGLYTPKKLRGPKCRTCLKCHKKELVLDKSRAKYCDE